MSRYVAAGLFLAALGAAIVMIFPLISALVYALFTGLEQVRWPEFFSGSLFFLLLALLALLVGWGVRRSTSMDGSGGR